MEKEKQHGFNTAMEDGAPSSRSRKTLNLNDEPVDESSSSDGILVAARKLMQLSDDDNNDDDNNISNDEVVGKRMRDLLISSEEADQRQPSKETIGNDIGVVVRPKKKRKYRSLEVIYMVTKPITTQP